MCSSDLIMEHKHKWRKVTRGLTYCASDCYAVRVYRRLAMLNSSFNDTLGSSLIPVLKSGIECWFPVAVAFILRFAQTSNSLPTLLVLLVIVFCVFTLEAMELLALFPLAATHDVSAKFLKSLQDGAPTAKDGVGDGGDKLGAALRRSCKPLRNQVGGFYFEIGRASCRERV